MRRVRGSSSRSGSPRTQNEGNVPPRVVRISGPQLLQALRGGQPGNRNAVKALEWLDTFDLSNPESIDLFLREVIRATWEGRLGTRAAGALNGSLRLLLEHLALPALERRIEELEKAREVKA